MQLLLGGRKISNTFFSIFLSVRIAYISGTNMDDIDSTKNNNESYLIEQKRNGSWD